MTLNSFKRGKIRVLGKASQMVGKGEEWLVKYEMANGYPILDEQCKPVIQEVRAVFIDGCLATDKHFKSVQQAVKKTEEYLIAA